MRNRQKQKEIRQKQKEIRQKKIRLNIRVFPYYYMSETVKSGQFILKRKKYRKEIKGSFALKIFDVNFFI